MNTACLLLLFFLLPHAAAEPFVPGQALDQNLVANVAASTFAFVCPPPRAPPPRHPPEITPPYLHPPPYFLPCFCQIRLF